MSILQAYYKHIGFILEQLPLFFRPTLAQLRVRCDAFEFVTILALHVDEVTQKALAHLV